VFDTIPALHWLISLNHADDPSRFRNAAVTGCS
jgi:hypothetical protein